MKETNITDAIRFTLNGCGEGHCGSCTVLLDGEAIHACQTPVREQAWQVLDRPCDDPGILIDLDTPEDYERALGEHDPLPRAGRSSTGR